MNLTALVRCSCSFSLLQLLHSGTFDVTLSDKINGMTNVVGYNNAGVAGHDLARTHFNTFEVSPTTSTICVAAAMGSSSSVAMTARTRSARPKHQKAR